MQVILEAAPSPCVCAQRGYCPRNPDGACRCDHHAEGRLAHDHRASDHRASGEHDATGSPAADAPEKPSRGEAVHGGDHGPDRPAMRPCETGTPDGLRAAVVMKWIAAPAVAPAAPRRSGLEWPAPPVRGSQRVGADIVVPPWRA
jgi:hypothetical protein